MNSYRYAFPALAMVALSTGAWAQSQPVSAGPAATPAAAQPPAQSTPQPAGTVLGAEAAAAPPDSAAESKPRIIQGNDVVVAPAKPVAPIAGAPLTFSFEEAPVGEVVRTLLGDILKAPYVLHPPLAGTVTLSTRTPIPPDQAVFLLESALQANGLAMMRDARGTYHVGRPDLLRNIGGSIRQAGRTGPLPPGYGAIVIPLQYIGAGEMASILRSMVPADAIVRVDPLRNLLVMAGTRTQAEGWLDMVNTFDVDLLKGMSVGVFPLKHVSIQEVETALRLMSGGGGAGASAAPAGAVAAGTAGAAQGRASSGNAGGAPAALGEANPFFGALRIVPIERLNSILVVTPRAAYLEEARRWIEKLDQPGDSGAEPQLHIYKVQNGNAKHLAGVLSGIFGGGSMGGSVANSGVAPGLASGTANSLGQTGNSGFGNTGFGNQGYGNTGFGNRGFGGGNSSFRNSGFGSGGGGFGSGSSIGRNFGGQNTNGMAQGAAGQGAVTASIGGIRVMADELNNSILVWGTNGEFAKIEATLKRLDLPPTQVLIDASIIEVTLNDTLEYGLQWAFSGGAGSYDGVGVLSNGGRNGAPSRTSLNNTAVGDGFTYSLTNSVGNVRVVLNALASKGLVKMVSNPSLMVLDNHVAQMSVGDQVPVLSNIFTSTDNLSNTQRSYQYRDTGVNLAVTPSVNAGNLVTMQIDQNLTDLRSDSNPEQPSFVQRQISSKVAVRSGETVVLGGLIKDNQDSSKRGVPLVQDIPLIGNLFGANTRTGGRTELLVILTPRVVRTDPEIREVSEDLRDRLKGLRAIDQRYPADPDGGGRLPAVNLPLRANSLPSQ